MNALVIGGAGFLGCILNHQLLEKGYKVKCLDSFYFGEEPLTPIRDRIEIIREDIRTFRPSILKGIDIVVNLAAIAQPDRLKILDSKLFYEINHLGCTRVAKLSKEQGIKRYIFTSTNSVYGFQKDIVNELSTPNPLEDYGKSKLLAEKDVLSLADDNFTVTILRFATLYGISPKMRFDLLVNGITWALYKYGRIDVMRDGNQWRSTIHVKDAAKIITKLIESSKDKVQKEIFNVGSNDQNYQIYPLAKLIGDYVGKPYDIKWYGEPDKVSYRVDFVKLKKKLNFKVKHNVLQTVKDLYDALNEGLIEKNEKTSVINWYKNLSENGTLKLLRL